MVLVKSRRAPGKVLKPEPEQGPGQGPEPEPGPGPEQGPGPEPELQSAGFSTQVFLVHV